MEERKKEKKKMIKTRMKINKSKTGTILSISVTTNEITKL